MKWKFHSIVDIENEIRRCISDAARLSQGAPFSTLNCALNGIRTPEALSKEIIDLGEIYIQKMKAIRSAAPVKRGNTISIYAPTKTASANAPSKDDEKFLSYCRRQLSENGYVLARHANTYEEIAKKYPDCVSPRRVRGAEAREYLSRKSPDAVAKAVAKALKKRGQK